MLRVTCAIIIEKELIFCAQRSETMPLPLKWEFPGGKIEHNETEETCLIREIEEELNVSIEILKRLTPNIHALSETKTIELIPFLCEKKGDIKITLKEHKTGCWLPYTKLHLLDWAEADLPIVTEIQKMMR